MKDFIFTGTLKKEPGPYVSNYITEEIRAANVRDAVKVARSTHDHPIIGLRLFKRVRLIKAKKKS